MKLKGLFIPILLLLALVGCNSSDTPESKDKESPSTTDTAYFPAVDESKIKDINSALDKKTAADFYGQTEVELPDVMDQDSVYLVYFYSPQCGFCNRFSGIVKEYTELPNSYPLYTVDVSKPKNQQAWDEYELEGTPALLLIDGKKQKEIARNTGIRRLEEMPLRN